MTNWRNALASAASTVVNVASIGDSITVGAAADSYESQGFVALLRAQYQSLYGDGGYGFCMLGRAPEFWTFAGSSSSNGTGPFNVDKTATGNQFTARLDTGAYECDSVDVYWTACGLSGSFDFQIDGGEFTNYPVSTHSPWQGKKTNIPCSFGPHTFTVRAPATGHIVLSGGCLNKGSTGMRWSMLGISGTNIGAAASTDNRLLYLEALQPKLTLLAMTTNDFVSQTPLATFQANTERLIQKAKLHGDAVLVIENWRNYSGAIPQASYNAVYQALGASYGCAVVDMYSRWGGGPNSTMIAGDGTHPTTAGHADMAQAIQTVLQH